jgi:hypothetical protein
MEAHAVPVTFNAGSLSMHYKTYNMIYMTCNMLQNMRTHLTSQGVARYVQVFQVASSQCQRLRKGPAELVACCAVRCQLAPSTAGRLQAIHTVGQHTTACVSSIEAVYSQDTVRHRHTLVCMLNRPFSAGCRRVGAAMSWAQSAAVTESAAVLNT